MKNFIKEFKEFAVQGNVMDMAVGIVIGGAFTAIVNSLVADLISPILGLFVGDNFAKLKAQVGDVTFTYGNFIMAVVNFVLVAFVLFMIVKAMNKVKREEPAEEEATTKECPYCHSEIPIAATRCPHCTSELEAAE